MKLVVLMFFVFERIVISVLRASYGLESRVCISSSSIALCRLVVLVLVLVRSLVLSVFLVMF